MAGNALKVAHITTVDSSLRYLLLNQLQAIGEAGYEPVGISTTGPDVTSLEQSGIHHIAVPMSRNFTPFADLVSLRHLVAVMRRERFGIVHTHTPKAGLLGQLAARLAGVPIVINTLHGFYFHDRMRPASRRFYIALEKLAARCSDVILSQNSEDIQTAIAEGICAPSKIKHLGNGIDLSCFDPDLYMAGEIRQRKQALGIPSAAPVVGFVGRLAARRKGFLDFLQAGKYIAERLPEVRFLIVGEADHGKPDAVEPAAAGDFGIADRCVFLGQQPNRELPLLYRTMSLLVLPSLFEGVPRAVMEASAMRVPAVVTDVKGNREVVEDGVTGLLVPYGDPMMLADAVLEVLQDREKACDMGHQGRRKALERFDERLVFDKVLTEYAHLARKKGLPLPTLRTRLSQAGI